MLKHPNIIRLYDVKKQNNVIFMIMELCNEKVGVNIILQSLNDYLKNHKDITELEIRYMFGQVLNGFKYLRSLGIIHRDVKPENILIRNSVLKIADFGFAKQHDSKAILHSYLGTRATIAPQVIMGMFMYILLQVSILINVISGHWVPHSTTCVSRSIHSRTSMPVKSS